MSTYRPRCHLLVPFMLVFALLVSMPGSTGAASSVRAHGQAAPATRGERRRPTVLPADRSVCRPSLRGLLARPRRAGAQRPPAERRAPRDTGGRLALHRAVLRA